MSEVKKIATRDSYGNALVELAQNGADNLVVLDADLAAATKTGTFKKAFPERHFNCGIARVQHDRRGCRFIYDVSCSLCQQLCDVCRGQSF